MMQGDTIIRDLNTHDELRTCEDIQRRTWNMRDLEIVSMHTLVALNKQGGMVLGVEVDGELAGFLFGYAGWLKADSTEAQALGERHFHASQMLGILPEYQNRGLGYLLKKAQLKRALEQGHKLSTWTFDPLLSRNAYFNIKRLGVIARAYIRNLYDELPGINAGLPTDRLNAEWWLTSTHVAERIKEKHAAPDISGAERANESAMSSAGFRIPTAWEMPGSDRILVEIPYDFDSIKQADMDAALAWRMHMREVLEEAFAQSYAVIDFLTEKTVEGMRSFYVLHRSIDLRSLAEYSAEEALSRLR